jgi:ribosomal protein S18 acetylase RimI-like enzyme
MANYREATAEDLPFLCELGGQVNALHHAAWPHIFAAPGAPERDRDHWLQGVGGESAATFVAEDGGLIIGFVSVNVVTEAHSLMKALRYARIGSVVVDANHRGRGVGSTLMALAQEWAVHRGAEEMRLNVWAFNKSAMSMYADMGYEVRSHVLGKRLGGDDSGGS